MNEAESVECAYCCNFWAWFYGNFGFGVDVYLGIPEAVQAAIAAGILEAKTVCMLVWRYERWDELKSVAGKYGAFLTYDIWVLTMWLHIIGSDTAIPIECENSFLSKKIGTFESQINFLEWLNTTFLSTVCLPYTNGRLFWGIIGWYGWERMGGGKR